MPSLAASAAALLSLGVPTTVRQLPAQEPTATDQQAPKPTRIAPAPGALVSLRTIGNPAESAQAWSLVQMIQQPDFAEVLEDFGAEFAGQFETMQELTDQLRDLGRDPGEDPTNPFADLPPELRDMEGFLTSLQGQVMKRPMAEQLKLTFTAMDFGLYLRQNPEDGDEPFGEFVLALEMPASTKAAFRADVMAAAEANDVDITARLAEMPKVEVLGGLQAIDLTGMLPKDMEESAAGTPGKLFMLETDTQLVFVLGNTEDPLARLVAQAAPESGATEAAPAVGNRNGGYRMAVDIAGILEVSDADGEMDDDAMAALEMLGLKGIRTVDMLFTMGADGLRTAMSATSEDGFGGLLGCLIGDDGAHPMVPMEGESGLMHASWAVDLPKATQVVRSFMQRTEAEKARRREEMRKEMGISKEEWEENFAGSDDGDDGLLDKETWDKVVASLDGRMGMGVAAPLMGASVPRVGMAWGIRDPEAFDRLVGEIAEEMEGIDFVTSDYEGYRWTRVVIPNAPALLVPSFARIDKTLYLADRPNTLWTMLDMVKADNITHGIAVDNAAPGLASGPANAVRIAYDTGRVLRLMQETYMPLARLGMDQMMRMEGVNMDDMFSPDELPVLEEWLPYMGVGTGGIRIDGGRVEIGSRSALGGPLMTTLMAFGLPMGPTLADMGMTIAIQEMEAQIAAARAEAIAEAINAWKQSFGGGERLPPDLGSLLARGLITDETLLLAPGDRDPDAVEFENEDGEIEELDCSFRYVDHDRLKVDATQLFFANEMRKSWPGDQEPLVVLLYEARDTGRGRVVVTRDGTVALLKRADFQELLGIR